MRTRAVVLVGVAVVIALAAASTLAIAATRDTHDHAFMGRSRLRASCAAPDLRGTVVAVSLMNAGGPMSGGPMMGGVRGGMMRLVASPSGVRAGTVSFIATNLGSVNHELVVLPLPGDQIVGTRAVRSDGTIDEAGSLGEASNTCGAGSGDGIAPGAASWVTLTLARGRYELVCNLPGHYAAGMYAQLTVQ